MTGRIDLAAAAAGIKDYWQPRIVADLNDYHFKLARIKGDFTWHRHEETDEAFLVLEGALRMDFEDGSTDVGEGQLIVVPRGVLHKPHADAETVVLLMEPAGTLNTGDVIDDFTVKNPERL